ncbi:MAG: MBL fold metallo-hydrolase [Myxococcaceae bacterium]|nr:MBL fold metallo-hydrolase [Myxococcaceae bacterium]
MDLGFETIGNATLICHDQRPILVTDPWLTGSAYFGSWTFSHDIPEEQRHAISRCEYVWLSHGHPDHLSAESLAQLRSKKVLLPNHFGGRIYEELRAQGYDVHIVVDREWIELSPRIRVLCIPDYNQDAVLLVDLGGTLVVNLNDASDHGWSGFVRRIIRTYPKSFLLALSGYGDADMIHYKTEDGARIPPPAALKSPVGQSIARQVEYFGARWFVPFSSMHRYQRTDSLWADAYTTRLDDYPKGFASKTAELTPAFIRYECDRDRLTEIRPAELPVIPKDPKEFGDDWSEPLEAEDVRRLEQYFRAVEHLERSIDFITFRVGGREHRIELGRRRFRRGITFEAPRHSLMTAVRYEIFDDLLIGNFMSTTLHGDAGPDGLYPDFTPWVAKYGDNGRARSRNEVNAYFRAYRRRDPLGFLRHRLDVGCVRPLQESASRALRERLGPGSKLFRATKELYWSTRRALG